MVGSYPQNNRADAEKQRTRDNHRPSGTIRILAPHASPPKVRAYITCSVPRLFCHIRAMLRYTIARCDRDRHAQYQEDNP